MKDLINILTEKLLKDKAISSLKYVNEIKVRPPSPINQLLDLQSRIEASQDDKEQHSLAIQCAEIVLFIWEKKYPDDNRPRKAIEAAKAYLANPTEENQEAAYDAANDADDAADAAYEDTAASSAAYTAVYAINADVGDTIYAAASAIKAVENYYNLNEIKVRPPSPLNQLLDLQSKIKASNDPKEQHSLAIQCAERVLFIFEEKYPNDNRPRKAIEAAKAYLANPTEKNKKVANDAADDAAAAEYGDEAAAYAAAYAAYAANAVNAANYAAAYAADAAITAVKEYYNLNESINEMKSNIPINLKEAIKSLTEYMINQGMDIEPLPKLKLINNDSKNASNILGRTACYNSNDCSITLFTLNRHPKDILRSYAHEMIHRMQDNEGRLNHTKTTNTNEDEKLEELEKEAYLKGNICLRNWEDEIKNTSINENEEPTFSNTNVENEWELKILNDLTAEKLKEMLLNPKYSEGSFVIQGEGLKDILQQTFGFPNTPSNIKKNEELFKTKTKYLYNDISNKVGKFKPSQLDIIRDKDGKLLFMFLKNNKDNQTLVKDYYEQISKKSLQSDLNPEIINSTTIRFPLSDTANLNKILDNLQKAKILTNEDYTLKKQPKL